jgi:hypothetical protein
MPGKKIAHVLLTVLVLALVLALTASVLADEPNVGTLRITDIQHPDQVAPLAQALFRIDVEYAVHTNATIKSSLFAGPLGNLGRELWQSDPVVVSDGGDEVWNVTLTAPSVEGDWSLTAFAYYREGSKWICLNDTLQGPGAVSFSVKVANYATLQVELGIPKVSVTIDNSTETTSDSGSILTQLSVGQQHEISVPVNVEPGNQTRLVFSSWQDGSNNTHRVVQVDGDVTLATMYRAQYLLQVDSVVRAYSYSVWKDAYSNVSLYANGTVPMGWPLGSLGARYVFQGWSGSVQSNANALNVTMDEPRAITANYYADYTRLIIPAIVALGIIGGITLSVIRKRAAKTMPAKEATGEEQMEQTPQEVAEDETDESKPSRFCDSCGGKVEEDWTHCINCGRELSSPESGSSGSVQRGKC